VVNKIVLMKCNINGADRALRDTGNWRRWWPSGGRVQYRVSQQLRRGAGITILDGGREISSMLTLFPLIRIDSSYIQWHWAQTASLNPLKRIGQYQEAKRLKGDMGVILDSLKCFVEDRRKLYGVDIVEQMPKDSFLLETNRIVKGYPGTAEIYGIVKKLESFASGHGGERTGDPMMNIDSLEEGQYRLKVAIPVSKQFQNAGGISFRKLVKVKGTFLETDVYGGPGAIKTAMGRINNYLTDCDRIVVALPFLSLATDRSSEPDSTKWLTRIYYPVIPSIEGRR
jgi:hypothetical protein